MFSSKDRITFLFIMAQSSVGQPQVANRPTR
jgi:hypothetical protein